jgi:hypothetical protein
MALQVEVEQDQIGSVQAGLVNGFSRRGRLHDVMLGPQEMPQNQPYRGLVVND